MSTNFPDLDSNQDLDLRRVQCDPLQHREMMISELGFRISDLENNSSSNSEIRNPNSQILFSTGARSRTLCGCFGDSLLSREHTGLIKRLEA